MRSAFREPVRARRHPLFGFSSFHFVALIVGFTILWLVLFCNFESAVAAQVAQVQGAIFACL